MIDELVRQEGVQQRFHRRIGRAGIQQVDALIIDHVLVGQLVQFAQLADRLQLHRRQTLGFDIAHVPARAFDADHLHILTQHVLDHRLDRGVAAAMQHQLRVLAQQARGIGAQRQVLVDALAGIIADEFPRVGVGPFGLHLLLLMPYHFAA